MYFIVLIFSSALIACIPTVYNIVCCS